MEKDGLSDEEFMDLMGSESDVLVEDDNRIKLVDIIESYRNGVITKEEANLLLKPLRRNKL